MRRNEIGPLSLHHSQKLTQKRFKHLNVRTETVRHLEENIGENILGIGFGKDFMYMTPKAHITKVKIELN